MEGIILILTPDNKRDLTELNHKLFGRISKMNDSYYYYSGLFEDIPYLKLAQACYFVPNKKVTDFNLSNLKLINSNISCTISDFITAKEYWKQYSIKNKVQIKNL